MIKIRSPLPLPAPRAFARRARLGFIVTISVLLTGCAFYPHQRALTPIFQGTVVDAETNQPIENARIEVVGGYPTRNAIGRTDDLGAYQLGVTEEATWYFVRPLLSKEVCSGKITFSHPSYEPKSFSDARFAPAVLDGPCGEVKLDVELKKILGKNSQLEPNY